MKKFFVLSVFIILFSHTLFAKIFEVKNFSEIKKHIQKDSLILIDIDDTLIVPKHMLGCDSWFNHQFQHLQQTLPSDQALEKSLALWESIRHVADMELVEKTIPNILRELQSEGYSVMGLTTQGVALATRTVQHLQQFQIDLNASSPCKDDYYIFHGKHGGLYRKGILFTSGQKKGEFLMKLCEGIDIKPKHVVFINDKESHLEDVQSEVEKYNIDFVGLRYGFCDPRKENFDFDVALTQLKHSNFERIISDDEARKILNHQSKHSL